VTIKPATIEAIQASKNILVDFNRLSDSRVSVSVTYYDDAFAYTVKAYTSITHAKYIHIHTYYDFANLCTFKDFAAEKVDKATGHSLYNNDQSKIKAVLMALCEELSCRTDSFHVDAYQSFRK